MTYTQQQHLRSLLTDAIVELCRRESFYVEELRIEGTICIVSDRSSVVIAQITEQVGEKFSDAEPDNGEVTFEDDSTVPFKNKDSNGQSNADEDTCSNISPEDEGQDDEDYKDDRGKGSSGAQHDSEMPCLESNHIDDSAGNIGVDVAEQLANIMSIYNQVSKTEDSPARQQQQQSPFGHQSSVVKSEVEGFPAADVMVGFDENVSLERSANGKFQCPYCVKSYGFKHTLKEHLNKHMGKRPHVCKHCGDSFTHLASLCAHVKRRHDDLMPQDFQCVICQEKLMNYQSLKQHYTWRHKDVKFPEDKLDQDALNPDDGDALELDPNSKPKRRRRSRRQTFVKPETEDFAVDDQFGEEGQKKIKIEFSDEGNNTLPLDSSALLEAFERKDYESIQEGFAASFLDNLGLDGSSDVKFRDDGTSSAAGLGFQKMDGGASDTFQYAQMIARYFDEIHIETEQGLYRYRCKVCSNMFKIRNSLYEHLNSHLGKKPHQCSYCGDSFAHHSSLHNHVRNKHSFQTSAEKQASFKHFCLGCDRKFRYRSELERHLKCNPDHAMGALPVQ